MTDMNVGCQSGQMSCDVLYCGSFPSLPPCFLIAFVFFFSSFSELPTLCPALLISAVAGAAAGWRRMRRVLFFCISFSRLSLSCWLPEWPTVVHVNASPSVLCSYNFLHSSCFFKLKLLCPAPRVSAVAAAAGGWRRRCLVCSSPCLLSRFLFCCLRPSSVFALRVFFCSGVAPEVAAATARCAFLLFCWKG